VFEPLDSVLCELSESRDIQSVTLGDSFSFHEYSDERYDSGM
jgi:hypothetical protein